MIKAFLPKGAPFFEYLMQQNEIVCSTCSLILRLFDSENAPSHIKAMTDAEIHQTAADLEEKGDALYMQLVRDLSQTFITPIDREDIIRVGKELEATVDLFFNLVARLYVFNIPNYPVPMRKLANNLNDMALLTKSMLNGLAQKKDSHDTLAFRTLRNESEMLISSGLGEVLDVSDMTPQGVLSALKLTRAYDRMEQAILQVNELAEAIEEAVLKNV